MRQKNREVSNREELLEIMRRCDVCRLALNNEGYPYIVPLNFGLSVDEDKISLIFHSALEGMKLDLIRKDNRASFEMDGKHQLQYFEEQGYCTMAYESVIGSGTIRFLSDKEKEQALRALMDQYHPGKMLILIRQQSPERRFMFLKLRLLPEKGSCQSDTVALQY